MKYPFQLEKYRNSKSRYHCPRCGKKEFARYIDEFGNHLSSDVGRCNREIKCGYHFKPREFFAINPTYSTKRKPFERQKKFAEKPRVKAFSRIDERFVKQTFGNYERNNFIQFLKSIFPHDTVRSLIRCFCLGTWVNGACVFWQIDKNFSVRTGKIISFDKEGHRSGYISWVHSELLKQKKINEFELKQSLFAEHLIILNPKIQTVAIVESEKTAVICQVFWQNIIFLACGGLSNLNSEKLEAVKSKKILLFPDSDGYEKWKIKSHELSRKGFNIRISEIIERMENEETKENGYDLADYLINEARVFSNRVQ